MREKKINVFITSSYFPSISLTGRKCALRCQHCRGKLLESLIPATTSEELEKKALSLHRHGAKGILLTGGCDERGCVPVERFVPAIRSIKERTDLKLIAHTGFLSKKNAALLKGSGLDGIGFDVVGDMTTAREVYGLSVTERDYTGTLLSLRDAGIMVFPHVCVGIHFGELRGEYRALELIREIRPSTVIITGLMPVSGTPMAHRKPKPSDFGEVIEKAMEMFPDAPVVLGCAHSRGKDREMIEKIALHCGVSGIASPTPGTIAYAQENGYQIHYYGTCCGLLPIESMRIRELEL